MSRNFTPEQTLIDRFLLGDAEAFEELTRRYCYSLYSYCLTKLSSPRDARRIVRTIFISLWEKKHALPFDFSPSIYLYGEVRKAVIQCLNSKLNNDSDIHLIREDIIPGFSVPQLQQARQPVKNNLIAKPNNPSPVVKKGKYEDLWRNVQLPMNSLKGLKHALQNMLNLF